MSYRIIEIKISKIFLRNILFLMFFLSLYLSTLYNYSKSDPHTLQKLILETEAKIYLITFILFIFLIVYYRKSIIQELKILRRNDYIIIAFVFLIAVLVREFVPPKTTRLFFDEDIYLDMAKQITKQLSSCLCNYGNKNECFRCELMKWPVGHPFLISVPFFIFGSSDMIASNFMILLSSLSVVLVFLTSYIISGDRKTALFSALTLALAPVHILWSVTSAADVSLAFFVTLVLFFSVISTKSRSLKIHAISLLALVLAVQAKTEGAILIPVYFISQILLNSEYLKMFERASYVFIIIFSSLLLSIYFLHTFYAARVDTWGSSGEKISLNYLKQNLRTNIGYWLEIPAIKDSWAYHGKQLYHPFLLTIVAIIGLAYLFKKDPKKALTLLLWFSAFFLLYASFYAGSVYYGVDVRYTLTQYIPFSILCGFGFYFLLKVVKKFISENVAIAIFIVLIFLYFSLYAKMMHIPPEQIEESYGARLYRKSVIEFASKQPDDCYFISHVSSIYSWLGKGHLQIWYIYLPELDQILKDKECVFLDEGYWCAINVPESQSCKVFHEKYKMKLVYSVNDTKENKVYSIYRIVAK